jgi:ATP-dependent protease ClpP protease subunit
MSLKYFKNQGDGKFEMVLHGIIGLDIDGPAVAREIAALNEFAGATEIVERINSIGGSVVQGFSIVSANLQSKAKIITVCEGVCDSIASLILASGDERKVIEFGSGLIHNIMKGETSLNDMPEGKDKEEATALNNSIKNVLLNKTNIAESELSGLMDEGTRFTADELVDRGFADEKILIGKGKDKPALMENASREQWMNICKEFSADKGQNINKNHKQMKTVLTFLNLNAEASEEAVLSAIKDMQNKAKNADTLQQTVNTLTAENRELKKAKAEQEVDGYINKGMFDVSKKEELVNMCMEQPEAFKALSMMKPEYVNISETLKGGKKPKGGRAGEPTEKELADEFVNMQQNDPAALEELERTDKAKFENMLNAYNNVD